MLLLFVTVTIFVFSDEPGAGVAFALLLILDVLELSDGVPLLRVVVEVIKVDVGCKADALDSSVCEGGGDVADEVEALRKLPAWLPNEPDMGMVERIGRLPNVVSDFEVDIGEGPSTTVV